MRVLQVLSSLYKNNGIVNVVMNLYRNIDRTAIQFDFLLFSHELESFEQEVLDGGSQIFVIPKPGIATFGSYKKTVNEFFREHGKEYDIVHCHDIVVGKYIGKAAKKAGCKFILHAHSTKFSEKKVRSVRNRILFIGAKKTADYFLACSYIAGKAMFGKNVATSKNFFVLLNGINFDRFIFDETKRLDVRKKYNISSDSVLLGCTGRLSKAKNCIFSLKIFNSYLKIHNNSYLIFVGDGSERAKIEKATKKMGLSNNVIITGVQSDVGAYLSAMDFYLFPSLFEGLGLSLVEAQANGLNCIASTNVPQEACVCNCKRLPIKSFKLWADNITPTEISGRNIFHDELQAYDIAKPAAELTQIYEELLKC